MKNGQEQTTNLFNEWINSSSSFFYIKDLPNYINPLKPVSYSVDTNFISDLDSTRLDLRVDDAWKFALVQIKSNK